MVWMYAMSSWALVQFIIKPLKPWIDGTMDFSALAETGALNNPVPWVATVLVGLALLMLVEAVRVITGWGEDRTPPAQSAQLAA